MIVETKKRFGELAEGESFFLVEEADKRLKMKTESVFVADEGCTINAVSLCDGVLHSYGDRLEVIPIPARVSF